MGLVKEWVNAAVADLETRRRWRFTDRTAHEENGKPATAGDPQRDARPSTDEPKAA